jgi:very-short-patch-repair endonuclease
MAVKGTIAGRFVTQRKEARARQLRRAMTPAEKVLWQAIRDNQLAGHHFRRQQVIAGFIVDFYCHAAGVIVNVDGAIHADQKEADAERDAILTQHGYVSLHVTNDEVLGQLAITLQRIRKACRQGKGLGEPESAGTAKGTLPLQGKGRG